MAQFGRLALHTWTIDTTPLETALAAARDGGFDAVELRRIDFKRCYEQGMPNGQVLDIVRAAESRSARWAANTAGCSPRATRARGCSTCWRRPARTRSRSTARRSCARPARMSATPQDAIENLKRGADICGKYGLTLAIEFNSQHDVINSIAALREILNGADRPNAGMLLDAYHLERSGAGGRGFADVAPGEIHRVPVQRRAAGAGRRRRQAADRPAAAGAGHRALERGAARCSPKKAIDGHLSYEAPNPVLWERSPFEVAREGVEAMRALIAKAASRDVVSGSTRSTALPEAAIVGANNNKSASAIGRRSRHWPAKGGRHDDTQHQTRIPRRDRECVGACAHGAGIRPAHAQYPERNLSLIVPYGAGGGTDITARLLAQGSRAGDRQAGDGREPRRRRRLDRLGRAGGGEARRLHARLSQRAEHVCGLSRSADRPQGTLESFTPIINHVIDYNVWAVKADSPFKTVKDVIDAAKKQPSTITVSAFGAGSDDHIAILGIEAETGTKFIVIHCKSTAEAKTQALGGHIHVLGANVSEVAAGGEGGQFRLLGVMAPARSRFLPDAPTFKEQGFNQVWSVTRGIAAPANLAKEAEAKLVSALGQVINSKEHQARAEQLSLEPLVIQGEDYRKFLKDNEQATKKLMKW